MEATDANLYRYVGNGPTNFTDPTGLIAEGLFSALGDFSGFNRKQEVIGAQDDLGAALGASVREAATDQLFGGTFLGPIFRNLADAVGTGLQESGIPGLSDNYAVSLLTYDGQEQILSTTLDFAPVAGEIKSGIELITGRDLVTGDPVPRWLSAIGLIPVFGRLSKLGKAGSLTARSADDVLDIVRTVDEINLRQQDISVIDVKVEDLRIVEKASRSGEGGALARAADASDTTVETGAALRADTSVRERVLANVAASRAGRGGGFAALSRDADRVPKRDILLDNNLVAQIADATPGSEQFRLSREFAGRLRGRLVIDEVVVEESLAFGRDINRFIEEFNVEVVGRAADSVVRDTLSLAGRTVINNDIRILSTARNRGLKVATSDRRFFTAALNLGLDARTVRFSSDRLNFFNRIRTTLEGRGIRDTAAQDRFIEELNNF